MGIIKEAQGLTDSFHTAIAQEVIDKTGKSAEDLARSFADEGLPQHVADYLQITTLDKAEQLNLLGQAYLAASKRTWQIAHSLQERGIECGYDGETIGLWEKGVALQRAAAAIRANERLIAELDRMIAERSSLKKLASFRKIPPLSGTTSTTCLP